MKPVDQEFIVGDGSGRMGDCLRACVASMLELPAGDVPHFAEEDKWLAALRRFLVPQGLGVRWVDPAAFPIGSRSEVIGIGMSPRNVAHAVLLDAQTGALVHDPHPSRAGLLGEPSCLLVVSQQQTCPGCGAQIPIYRYACPPCWRRLPGNLRTAILRAFGRRAHGTPGSGEEHADAKAVADQWFTDHPREESHR